MNPQTLLTHGCVNRTAINTRHTTQATPAVPHTQTSTTVSTRSGTRHRRPENFLRRSATLALSTLATTSAHAQLAVVTTTANNILTVLDSISIIIVAIAIFIAAALLVFRATSFAVAGAIVVGGAIMGSAVEVATWLVG